MDGLPDLGRLRVAEKDDLIHVLFAQVAALTAKLAELEGRLAPHSRNSSKPPSSDGIGKPKPKSPRQAGQPPSGGQPDHTETHCPPSHCDVCPRPLLGAVGAEPRPVFDIPSLPHEVTEPQGMEARGACGKGLVARVPKGGGRRCRTGRASRPPGSL